MSLAPLAEMTLEAFAARRRKAQTDIEARIRDEVQRSVDLHFNTRAWDELLDELKNVYAEVYEAESGERIEPMLPRGAITQIRSTLRKTVRHHRDPDPNSVERITVWLATAVLSLATIEASKADPEDLFLEWVSMEDEAVRQSHRAPTHGQVRPIGEPFDVDGVPMRYPGDPRAPIELWINCRCTLRPVLASEVNEAVSTGKTFARARPVYDAQGNIEFFVPAADDPPDSATLPEGNVSTVVVALPTEADDVHEAGEEPSHVTLLFLGEVDDDMAEHVKTLTEGAAGVLEPFNASVSGQAVLGPDKAKVLLLEAHEFNVARGSVEQDERVAALLRSIDTFPNYIPHLTVTYGDSPAEMDEFAEVTFDRLAVWHRDEQTEYPLGESMPEKTEASFAISEKPWNGSPSRFTDEQYKRSAILHVCDGMEKSCHKLPIREPNGDLSRAGVHAAAQRIGSVKGATSEQIASAKRSLRGAYKQLNEEPPDKVASAIDWHLAADEDDGEALTSSAETRVPWYGVLAPEGVLSGDRRGFREGALRHRDLPLPLTWQKISDDGHKGNVTVATIENIEKVDGQMRGSGYFLATEEANEVIDLVREFGQFGVSVDADEITMDMDEDSDEAWFSDARISSACVVPIPAFQEAWIALGTWADHEAEGHEAPDTEAAAARDAFLATEIASPEQFVDVAPGRTEDGPGWLTNPVDTDRLRDYWVSGPGAAKIAWGTAGDFDRCRANVAEYVKPQHINGYCANRHYDALGRWPGRHGAAAEALQIESAPAEVLSMTASAARGHRAPAAWFAVPEADEPTALTVTDDGQVYGHLATWGTCHIGFDGQCVDPPRSPSNYAWFLRGQVCLDNGERVSTGPISIGGGHAEGRMGARPAIEHYDSTSTAVADVVASDGEHGIWVCGWVRPGASDEQVTALRASGLSGDWRTVGGRLELVAALAVNVSGFPIRRQIAASAEGDQLSLVAAGVVPPRKEAAQASVSLDLDSLAVGLVDRIEAEQTARKQRREKMASLSARVNEE